MKQSRPASNPPLPYPSVPAFRIVEEAVIFAAGIGPGSAGVRALSVQGLECLGIRLDAPRNRLAGGFDEVSRISTGESKVAVLVVPTDEKRLMAREAWQALDRSGEPPARVAPGPQLTGTKTQA